MFRLRGVLAILAGGVLLGGMSSAPVAAADKGIAAVIGTVNVEEVFNGSSNKKKLDAELQNYKDSIRKQLELHNGNKLLSADEFKQLADISAKPAPTDDDKKKIVELTGLNAQRESEFTTLQQKKDPTDADKAKITQYQQQINDVQTSLQTELEAADTNLRNKTVELSKQVMEEVQKTVATVAKEKGLTLVLNKVIGDTMFVMFSNVDITSDVLAKLSK